MEAGEPEQRRHHGRCCDGGGKSWAASESLEEMDFRRSLSAAAQRNDIHRLRELIERGVQVDGEDSSGYTPLLYAARHGHLDACIFLLQNGADVNKCTRAGKATCLHRAAYAGHIDVVKTLLKAGADPLAKDVDGLSPLQKAEAQSHVEIVKLLRDVIPEHLKEHGPKAEGDQQEKSIL